MTGKPFMLEAKAPVHHIRLAYDLMSFVYLRLFSWFERKAILMGLERAAIQPDERVLEVAFGPGVALLEIARSVGGTQPVCGVDLSPTMLKRTARRLQRVGITNLDLREADARSLPFADATFDVVFNSYMMDLLPLHDIRVVLGEFRRVLKPGGRLVLVNFSKLRSDHVTWWERTYQHMPECCTAYLMGGCRPVVLAGSVQQSGFQDVHREFVRRPFPSEIIIART